ncbi:pyroglutamyl peptidase [Streptomyces sp. MAR25Y5]|uniref:pyroglutamyl peptidase n=1 Tax=Streptomyces sp. MAR25Y5 TaxID=2962028 RepID=UPI0020B87435|nr:pyroglutamyl peptidase [Streptomyces sp. MAR25Y5]MCP3767869.1 pyroglutamyl peptidase [Streptomyces sp. MAR25Y5]
MTSLRVRLALLGLALLAGGLAAPVPASAASAGATALPPTPEEQSLDGAVPQEILRRSGFDTVATEFADSLDHADSYETARLIVALEGTGLWRKAVDRAQGRGPSGGDLSRDDDRPLYWARLGMTRELRTWEPGFPLTADQRRTVLNELEETSRGQNGVHYPQDRSVKRILVTGFDPFELSLDARKSNPSGAAALALDGTVIRTADGPARIETVMFPVRWEDFTDGAVERALRPHLPNIDLFTTLSQGRPGRFDLERTNGAWRGGYVDNLIVSRTGTIPVAEPGTQPQWTTTTLPSAAVAAAGTEPLPVYDNTEVSEIPAGGTRTVVRPEGPTPGSTAREGGGGDYLSNEIAYRATLLRDRLGLHDTLPGGHLHTPVLKFGPENSHPETGTVTDPTFVENRAGIIAQTRAILAAAINATQRPRD